MSKIWTELARVASPVALARLARGSRAALATALAPWTVASAAASASRSAASATTARPPGALVKELEDLAAERRKALAATSAATAMATRHGGRALGRVMCGQPVPGRLHPE